ncbi:MAG: potassium channel family protein [Halothermotrichaceae bacterium]
MYVVIIGSGRTGSMLAGLLSQKGCDVVIIDKDESQFEFLSVEFSGFRVEGDALEQEVLKQAKIEQADSVLITTGNDKANYMIAQMASVLFEVSSIMVRVVDPEKDKLFDDNPSITTLSPISLLVDEMVDKLMGSDE